MIFDGMGHRVGGARLLAVVTLSDETKGRNYRLATERDYEAVRKAQEKLAQVASGPLPNGLNPIPDEPTPAGGGSGAGRAFSVQKYGMVQWGDLFTARQKLSLIRFGYFVRDSNASDSLQLLLALSLDRVGMSGMSLTRWNPFAEKMQHTFGRQALPIVWDFTEIVPTAEAPGNWQSGYELSADVVENWSTTPGSGQVQLADAKSTPLPDGAAQLWFTDPPYYDAVPYADLSDFFYVWLKRILPSHPLLRNPFETQSPLTPKFPEIVQDEAKRTPDGRQKDKAFFEDSMRIAFAEGRRALHQDGVGTVVFAHKTTEGWEALISGMLRGNWTVTASWPITTEMKTRLRARESAALSASVHLVCRPRPANAGIGGWEDILRELPSRIGDWMERLVSEGIRGADLVFSCIGPALELFSKYDKVETAEGREVKLDEFLEKVWEVVGRTALQQVLGTAEARARNGAASALEEDARLTALFLWTLQSTNGKEQIEKGKVADEEEEGGTADEDEEIEGGRAKKGYTLIYDVVRRFAQPLGIHLEAWDGRIIEVTKGVVRLLPVMEREEHLFGATGTHAVARALERTGGREPQYMLFPEETAPRAPRGKKTGRGGRGSEDAEALAPRHEATTLDRVHAAMLLQARGEATALRALTEAEIERSPDFLRLANALSALYPKDSEEKRLLDAMLLAVPR